MITYMLYDDTTYWYEINSDLHPSLWDVKVTDGRLIMQGEMKVSSTDYGTTNFGANPKDLETTVASTPFAYKTKISKMCDLACEPTIERFPRINEPHAGGVIKISFPRVGVA